MKDDKYFHLAAANRERVTDLCDYLVKCYETYLEMHEGDNGGRGVEFMDGFMAVHNFHKVVIFDIIKRLELDGESAEMIKRTAISTFEKGVLDGRTS